MKAFTLLHVYLVSYIKGLCEKLNSDYSLSKSTWTKNYMNYRRELFKISQYYTIQHKRVTQAMKNNDNENDNINGN